MDDMLFNWIVIEELLFFFILNDDEWLLFCIVDLMLFNSVVIFCFDGLLNKLFKLILFFLDKWKLVIWFVFLFRFLLIYLKRFFFELLVKILWLRLLIRMLLFELLCKMLLLWFFER